MPFYTGLMNDNYHKQCSRHFLHATILAADNNLQFIGPYSFYCTTRDYLPQCPTISYPYGPKEIISGSIHQVQREETDTAIM